MSHSSKMLIAEAGPLTCQPIPYVGQSLGEAVLPGIEVPKLSMTTQQTALQRYRRPRGQYPKRQDTDRRPKPLPEYVVVHYVDALIRAAPNLRAVLLFLVQWRAGLRVSEALALEIRDLSLDSELPTIHVR